MESGSRGEALSIEVAGPAAAIAVATAVREVGWL